MAFRPRDYGPVDPLGIALGSFAQAIRTGRAPKLRREMEGMILPYGYGYQWWLPAGDRDELQARGIYNQTIWVDRANDVVIVQLAANPAFGTSPDEEAHQSTETMTLLRTIAESVPNHRGAG